MATIVETGYRIQVKAAESAREGREVVARLASQGYPAYMTRAVVGNSDVFRVRIGPFDTLTAAEETASQLRSPATAARGSPDSPASSGSLILNEFLLGLNVPNSTSRAASINPRGLNGFSMKAVLCFELRRLRRTAANCVRSRRGSASDGITTRIFCTAPRRSSLARVSVMSRSGTSPRPSNSRALSGPSAMNSS